MGDTNFDDVGHFHARFGLENSTHSKPRPHLLSEDLLRFRKNFLQEELDEFVDATEAGDLAGAFDGLLDLVYVAMGTAHMMGLPWQEGWDLVQAANMTKVRAPDAESSKRHHMFDVIKPEGFVPPDIESVIALHSANGHQLRLEVT